MQRLVSALSCATAVWLVAASGAAQAPVPRASVLVVNPTSDASVPAALLADVRTALEALVRARPDLQLATGAPPYANAHAFVIEAHVTMTWPHATVELKVRDASSPGSPWTTFAVATFGGHPMPGPGPSVQAQTVVAAARSAWRSVDARIRP